MAQSSFSNANSDTNPTHSSCAIQNSGDAIINIGSPSTTGVSSDSCSMYFATPQNMASRVSLTWAELPAGAQAEQEIRTTKTIPCRHSPRWEDYVAIQLIDLKCKIIKMDIPFKQLSSPVSL